MQQVRSCATRRLKTLRLPILKRNYASYHNPRVSPALKLVGGSLALVAGVVGGGSYLISTNPIHADTVLERGDVPLQSSNGNSKPATVLAIEGSKNDLTTFTWGSNKHHTTSSDDIADPRRPRPFIAISGSGIALRDLAFHEKHAACVDASGNVYQWGDGFFDGQASTIPRLPTATLTGKDIFKLALSGPKVFALSQSGRVYVLSSSMKNQDISPTTPQTDHSSSWWNISRLWSSAADVDVIELYTDSRLSRGEKITSISAGRSHLLALTSSGRTFVAPITSSANSNGQLGIRKLLLPSKASTTPGTKVAIELLPKAVSDPFAMTTPALRRSVPAISPATSEIYDENNIRYCDTLFEVPSLKGVKILQAVASDRASYVLSEKEGRVLSWGANEYGQVGLGSAFTIEHVQIPTEVPLSRWYPSSKSVKCTSISAGGDVAYFTIETASTTSPHSSIDLLSCGMGQYGSLGNNLYTQSQGTPVKVKSISGIQEYNEATKSLRALGPKTVSASPTNHVLVTLDTFEAGQGAQVKNYDGPVGKGCDIMGWGANNDYQLGLGKRSNMALPVPLPSEAFLGTFDLDSRVDRMMSKERRVDAVKDFRGKTVKRNVQVRQAVVAGWNCSAVYWKVTP